MTDVEHMDTDGIKRLCNAIIYRAVLDAKQGSLSYDQFVKFVRSDYFRLLSRDSLSPDAVIKEVFPDGKKNDSCKHAYIGF